MPNCDKCIWSTRSGNCVLWECKFVSYEDARRMIEEKERKDEKAVRTMKVELKPCPFCSGEASVVQYVGDLYAVVCNYCFVRTSKYSEKEKAVSAWNRRDGENHDD